MNAERKERCWPRPSRVLHAPLAETKVELKDNWFRHSYISYRMTHIGDKARVALECGNSPDVILERKSSPPAGCDRLKACAAGVPPQTSERTVSRNPRYGRHRAGSRASRVGGAASGVRSPKAYLYVVACNLALMRNRRQHARGLRSLEEVGTRTGSSTKAWTLPKPSPATRSWNS